MSTPRADLRLAPTAPALACLLFLCGCGGSPEAVPTGGSAARKAARPVPVRTQAVTRGALVERIEGTGSLEAYQIVTVAARVEGVVEQVAVEEGDTVDPRRELAVVDQRRRALEQAQSEASVAEATAQGPRASAASARSRAGVERAEALARAAQIDVAESEAMLKRRERMRTEQPGLVPDEEIATTSAQLTRRREALSVAEAEVREAQGALAEAQAGETVAAQALATSRARLQLAAKVLDDTSVRAPIGGVVRRRFVTLGQYVRAGDPLIELVDRSRLRVRFRVSEAESVRLAKGQPFTFRVPSLGPEEHPGTLVHVDETASAVSRMVECLGDAAESGVQLKPGFFVVAAVERTAPDVLRVPEAAVQAGERGWVAYVVEQGAARRRALRLGRRGRDGMLEVLEGLAAGEALIVEGSGVVAEGQAVVEAPVLSAPPAAAPGTPR